MGIAEIQEGITGNNFMRDGVFDGNQTAYNWYSFGVDAVATVGSIWCGGWLKYNQPRIQAYNSMNNYNVKDYHLPGGSGNRSKFLTANQAELRALGKEAIKNTPMSALLYNSADSYKLTYNAGLMVGVKGQTGVRLVFSYAGQIITFFPIFI